MSHRITFRRVRLETCDLCNPASLADLEDDAIEVSGIKGRVFAVCLPCVSAMSEAFAQTGGVVSVIVSDEAHALARPVNGPYRVRSGGL